MNKLASKAIKGFTLIELMIVVAIIGILAAIAIPKFADLVTKSKESAVKGSLGSLRSAVSIYYSDTEGIFPSGSAATGLATGLTTAGKYLQQVPNLSIPNARAGAAPGEHSNGNEVVIGIAADGGTAGSAAWAYLSGDGHVVVRCTHNDTKSSIWSTW